MKVETQMTDIKESIEEHKIEQRQDFDKVLEKLDSLDGKFAGKWVEKIQIGIIVTVIGSIIGAVIYLI